MSNPAATLPAPERPPAAEVRGRVCLVTSAPISANPRLVKEADALAAAGHAVRVVSAQHSPWVVPWDEEVAAGKPWRHQPVRFDNSGFRPRLRRAFSKVRQAVARGAVRAGLWRSPAVELAYCRLYGALLE